MNLRFEQIESLHWLWLVLVTALLLIWELRARSRATTAFADQALSARLAPRAGLARRVVAGGLRLTAMALLVAALLDPRWGVRFEQVKRRGIDIVFVVDVSRSMLARDVRPDRLGRAKQYITDLVDALGGDRVALVAFAGVPAVRCPLTIDYGAFRLTLNELAPQAAARGGSLLGDALRLAGDCFTDEARDFKCVIVLSDGEDQGSYPVEAATQLFEEKGVRTFTVGIGDAEEGARIPLQSGGHVVYQGQEVWSKMDAATLRETALAGGGAYVPAGTSNVNLAEVYEQKIASAAGDQESQASRVRVYDPKYQWFAGPALALLLIEACMGLQQRARQNADDSTWDAKETSTS